MLKRLRRWFKTLTDILFGIEFLLVQIFLIYHLIRALFFHRP